MDSPDVESSGLSSSLEEEFMIDLEEFGGFDPIIAFTTVMIECKYHRELSKPKKFCSDAPEPPMLSSKMECSSSNKLGCEVLELEEGAEGVVLECSSSALPTGCVT